LDHLDGILNYCRTKVPLGVVEAVNGTIKSLLLHAVVATRTCVICRSRAQRMIATGTEFVVFKKAAYNAGFCRIPVESRENIRVGARVGSG
jgi:hypothetical protein